jgi:flagellar hook-basal body complex protein FliE
MSQMEINRIIAEIRRINTFENGVSIQTDNPVDQASFRELLGESIHKVNETQQNARELATRFELGDKQVSLAEVMVNMQKSTIAFTAMTQVRNRVLEAYREIMSMQI